MINTQTNGVILTLKEACDYIGYSKAYMYKLTMLNIIPHSKPNGKKIYFDKHKLDEWLLTSKHIKDSPENRGGARTPMDYNNIEGRVLKLPFNKRIILFNKLKESIEIDIKEFEQNINDAKQLLIYPT